VRAWLLAAATVAGCGFDPGSDVIDGDPNVIDAPADAPSIDANGDAPDAGPIDAAPVDAEVDAPPTPVCPTNPIPGCTTVLLECGGSTACYGVCTSPSASHAGAESNCVTWGGHLASVATIDEQNCIAAVVQGLGLDDVWVGLRQTGGGGPTSGWGWTDGTPYGAYTHWHSGQPDDNNGSENGQEDCGDLEAGWSWDWNDDQCNDPQAYVCERPRV
jgi:hypothetical protein